MWLLIPFFLQMVCIGIDEIYFHYKRGLPKWERIGHPIDTFSVLLCLAWLIYFPSALKVYIGLVLFSCILVTKDEFVHKHHCPAAENWLHAMLFILHPITLTIAVFMNPLFLKVQLILMTLFLLYQIILWNVIWKDKEVIKY